MKVGFAEPLRLYGFEMSSLQLRMRCRFVIE
jgi:hypothetical protein